MGFDRQAGGNVQYHPGVGSRGLVGNRPDLIDCWMGRSTRPGLPWAMEARRGLRRMAGSGRGALARQSARNKLGSAGRILAVSPSSVR